MPKPEGMRRGRDRATPLAPGELVGGENRRREFLERRARDKGAGDPDTRDYGGRGRRGKKREIRRQSKNRERSIAAMCSQEPGSCRDIEGSLGWTLQKNPMWDSTPALGSVWWPPKLAGGPGHFRKAVACALKNGSHAPLGDSWSTTPAPCDSQRNLFGFGSP